MPENDSKPKILSRFEIGWIYGWDADIEAIYQEQFNDIKEKDIE